MLLILALLLNPFTFLPAEGLEMLDDSFFTDSLLPDTLFVSDYIYDFSDTLGVWNENASMNFYVNRVDTLFIEADVIMLNGQLYYSSDWEGWGEDD